MARKRMIDPQIWTSEDFGSLSLLAQIYFIGIISNADDDGRIKSSGNFLRVTIRPYSTDSLEDVEKVLAELSEPQRQMFLTYEVDGARYGYLPKWFEYQKISHPTKSKIPKPPEPSDNAQEDSRKLQSPPPQISLDEISLDEGSVRESNGAEPTCNAETVTHSHSLLTPNLSLDDPTPTNRWLKHFISFRPTAGHPLRNLNATDVEDVRTQIADFIEWQGEDHAIKLLTEVFTEHPKPTTVKQAILYCSKKVEAKQGNGQNQQPTRHKTDMTQVHKYLAQIEENMGRK